MSDWTRRDLFKTGAAAALALQTQASPQTPDATHSSEEGRRRYLLDFGWRFHLGNANDPAQDFQFGAGLMFAKSGNFCLPGRMNFDDSDWEQIDLPHDWAVSLPFVDDPQEVFTGSKPLGRKYPATSIGWYRKVFQVPEGPGKRFHLEFDGVFRDSIVVFNNFYMGRNLSGYAPFSYDVTDFLNYGGKNTLVLRVDATEHEGWFYEGAGIYRHVWLTVTNPVHIPQWGTYVRSEVHDNSATVSITAEVSNDSGADQRCEVACWLDVPNGSPSSSATVTIPAWSRGETTHVLRLQQPQLWSPENPHLYRAVTRIRVAGETVDQYVTSFGIRSIRFDANDGFFLNGKRVELQGTCNHQDHAGVGTALPDRLQYFRVARLKEMGSNAERTSHNPPAPEWLDACDQLGMLVMDETRMMSSDPEGLSQLERMIRRDRNHPCVVIWSLGNEEPIQGTERGARIVETMKRLANKLDPTRPVTVAMNNSWGKGISNVVDVQGFNYGGGHNGGKAMAQDIDAFHAQFPAKPTVGTETASDWSTRGIYVTDAAKCHISAYDVNYPSYTNSSEAWWTIYAERRFLAGGFAWTGFDYRGEPSPYRWPAISSQFGIVDTCGFPKDSFYYYQAQWSEAPVLHLFPHWNWTGKEGQEIPVWVYTNLDRVELFLNGRSLGAQDVPKHSHVAWNVNFEPGFIEARGFSNGKRVKTARRETTGPAAQIVLRPDRAQIRADGEDVCVIAVEVQDAQGRLMPVAGNGIAFELSGRGRIIGVGNGDPSCQEADRPSSPASASRSAFNGLCVVLVQSTKQPGPLTLRATSVGLLAATVTITCEPVQPRAAL